MVRGETEPSLQQRTRRPSLRVPSGGSAPVEPPNDAAPADTWMAARPAAPGCLACTHCEAMSVRCFKLLHFGVSCRVTVNKEYRVLSVSDNSSKGD